METIKFGEIWETLSRIDCKGHTETKETGRAKLTYLSWTWAWAELMKRYPEATYTIREWDGKPWLNDPVAGVLVMTEVNIGGNVRTMWLPAMDSANNALKETPYTYMVKGYNGNPPIEKKVAAVDMMAINKALMRCLVKNLAMFGLGLNIYAGEDLPMGEEDNSPKRFPNPAKPSKEELQAAAPKVAKAVKKHLPKEKALEAWSLFKVRPSITELDDAAKKSSWEAILQEALGRKCSTCDVKDEEWDKVISHIKSA